MAAAAFYLLAVSLIVLSRSATGLILAIILHVSVTLAWLWVRFQAKMNSVHYWLAGGVLIGLLAVLYFKLDFLLGLFDRSSTFTGRVGLWKYLFAEVVSQRPLFGHGFGALWTSAGFQGALRNALGWPYPIVIGDSGYMDILLHLGYVGLVLFAGAFAIAGGRAAALAWKERRVAAFAPLLVLIWALLADITLSYFLETESFAWFVMFAFAFSAAAAPAVDRVAKIATSCDS
jgi:exopolysaccharide production protein ExoQ